MSSPPEQTSSPTRKHIAPYWRLSSDGSGWGAAGATTLRTVTSAPVQSTAEYCAPVWCRSAHTCLIDHAINYALRAVTECPRPTPADNLPILVDIQPAELFRKGATLSLACRAMEPGHLLQSALTYPSSGNALHLKSRHSFVPVAQQLFSSSDDSNRSAALWADHWWNAERLESTTTIRTFIPDPPSWNGPARISMCPAQ